MANFAAKAKKKVLRRLHFLEWLPKYTRSDVVADLVAGFTVGLTMMPQSIAYATLAGLPPQYGLYTAFIGSFTYVFFGTIKEVSIGPTSLMALLTFSYTEHLGIEYVILLSFLAGCIELFMGLLHLGFLVDFISPCLTSGFTSASAIIIIVAQLKPMLGLKLYTHSTFELAVQILKNLNEVQWGDAILGLSAIIFLLLFKQLPNVKVTSLVWKKALWFLSISKNALVVLLTALLAFYLKEFQNATPFALTGPVPRGLPRFKVPQFSLEKGNATISLQDMVLELGSGIVVVPVVAVLANVAIAKSFSSDVVDATQEMMTLGLCNIFGSFIQAMPSCGAFTRSAVASSSDVRTPLQGVYSGTVIILALSFLAPYFYYIPKASLAAVLITAASSLVDLAIYPKLWRVNKFDFVITLGTFILGVVFGVEISIIVGATLNAFLLLKFWSRPKVLTELRKDHQKNDYIYIRPEVGLFYPAADYLLEIVKKAQRSHEKLAVTLDCTNILGLDYPSAQALQGLINDYNKNNIKLCLINVQSSVYKTLRLLLDSSELHLCQQSDLEELGLSFGKQQEVEVKEPLLSVEKKTERKLSLYDNVM